MDQPPLFTREQIRRVDAVAIDQWGIPGLVLMENAGRGVADVMCELGIEGKVIIACAKGNNAGDGFVLARHLHLRGFNVEVMLCSDPTELAGDAKANFGWLERCSIALRRYQSDDQTIPQRFAEADWLVDALLGTGAVGGPRAPLDTVIRQMNSVESAQRLAIDIPSGLDCNTGQLSEPTFMADHTCTFVAAKRGFFEGPAAAVIGELHCLDIGIPWRLAEEVMKAE